MYRLHVDICQQLSMGFEMCILCENSVELKPITAEQSKSLSGAWLEGSMRPQDTLYTLQQIAASIQSMGGVNSQEFLTFGEDEDLHEVIDELSIECDNALMGYYVGFHPDDGACYGVWPIEFLG